MRKIILLSFLLSRQTFSASVGISFVNCPSVSGIDMTLSSYNCYPSWAPGVNQTLNSVVANSLCIINWGYGWGSYNYDFVAIAATAGETRMFVGSGYLFYPVDTVWHRFNWGDGILYTTPDPTVPPNADTKEPINFISGNNHFPISGISMSAPGIPLEFTRYYNSTETNAAVLGKGWQHTYDWTIAVESNAATVTTGDARTYTFNSDGTGMYSASFDNNWQLSAQTNGEHTLLLPGSIKYRFDTNGFLQAISDGWSNRVSLIYSNGLLNLAEHSNGQSLEFTYSNGLLSAVTAATNLNISFAYDTNGGLTGAIRQVGAELLPEAYSYDSSLLLTQRVDSVGSDYHYAYNTNGQATGMYLTGDQWYEHAVSYNYNSTNAAARNVTYWRNGATISHDYWVNPYILRITEEQVAGNKTLFTYYGKGDLEYQTTYDVNTNHWTQVFRLYDDWHNVTNEAFGLSTTPTNITKYTWDTNWQVLTSETDPEGFKQEYEYTNGVIALSRIYLSSNTTAETTFGYTTNGLLSVITNANGHTTSVNYDDLGYPETVVPQVGPTVTFGHDSLGHLTNSAVGGRQIGYTVNPLGWIERIDYADSLYETFRYNGLGKVTNQVDRAGRVASYTYAPGGKLTAVSRQLGSTNVTVSYDFDQQFNTLAIRDELNRPVESYALDPLDRPTTVTNLENQTMSIRYLAGDFVDSITRFDSTVVSNQYNGDGRLATVSYPDETNRYTYLRNGLVQTMGNSKGSVSNGWNSASWLTQTVASAASVTSVVNYAYDPVGNITNSVVSIGGRQIGNSYSYDEAERLTNIVTETQGFVYSYNTNNGLVASMLCTNTGVQVEYDYDLLDRIRYITWKDSWGATILAFDYQYNAAGMITNVIKNSGSPVSYQYDDLDRLTGVTTDSGLVEYSYDAAGNRQTKTGGDFAVSYTPGTGNRLQSWAATSTNGFAGFRTVRVQGHSSEPVGTDTRWGQLWVSNTVAVVPDINGTNFSVAAFTVGMGTQTVVAAIRDQAGNVGYATNEIFLTVVTNGAYQYSAAGCVTNIAYRGTQYAQTTKFGWNSQYQLTSVSSAKAVVEYSYDVLGRRTSISDGTNTEHYVYDGDQVVADVDTNGAVLRTYVWGAGIDNLLSMTVYTNGTTNTYFALTDQQGTVHALADSSGNVVESYEYDAWGKVLAVKDGAGNILSQSAIGNRYLWQGREYDAVTGLYYFRARWYDPVVGRFISNDPIGISGGLNMYVFCSNNPVNSRDPSGLFQAGMFVRGFSGAVVSGVGAVVGAAAATTGVGSVPGGALALYSSYSFGANIGNMVNSFRDVPAAPTGPIAGATVLATNSRRARNIAEATDLAIPFALSIGTSPVAWSRLPTTSVGSAGTLAGTLQRVPGDPAVIYPWIQGFQIGDAGLTAYDALSWSWNDAFNNNHCK